MCSDQPVDIDFLCIGAQKAATSWLWSNLKKHPDVWLPPRKELHYFDRSLKYPSPSHLADDHALSRILSAETHNQLFLSLVRKELFERSSQHGPAAIQWYVKYFFEDCSDDWYRSLFAGAGEKRKGEITPSYSILDDHDVGRIRSMFPNLRVILILRDPVERAWSHIRFMMRIKRLGANATHADLIEAIESPLVSSRGNYPEILRVWKSHFPNNRILFGYYDEIRDEPGSFLRQVFDFLELENVISESHLAQQFNRSPAIEMPMEIRTYLCRKYLPDLEKLTMLSSPYPQKWLADCRQTLGFTL